MPYTSDFLSIYYFMGNVSPSPPYRALAGLDMEGSFEIKSSTLKIQLRQYLATFFLTASREGIFASNSQLFCNP